MLRPRGWARGWEAHLEIERKVHANIRRRHAALVRDTKRVLGMVGTVAFMEFLLRNGPRLLPKVAVLLELRCMLEGDRPTSDWAMVSEWGE